MKGKTISTNTGISRPAQFIFQKLEREREETGVAPGEPTEAPMLNIYTRRRQRQAHTRYTFSKNAFKVQL